MVRDLASGVLQPNEPHGELLSVLWRVSWSPQSPTGDQAPMINIYYGFLRPSRLHVLMHWLSVHENTRLDSSTAYGWVGWLDYVVAMGRGYNTVA